MRRIDGVSEISLVPRSSNLIMKFNGIWHPSVADNLNEDGELTIVGVMYSLKIHGKSMVDIAAQ